MNATTTSPTTTEVTITIDKSCAGAAILALHTGEGRYKKEMNKAAACGDFKTANFWRDRIDACAKIRHALIGR